MKTTKLRHFVATAIAVSTLACLAGNAEAISISIDSITKLGGNTATGIYGPNGDRQSSYDSATSVLNGGSSAADVLGSTVTAATRYASTQTSDADGFLKGSATLTANASYQVVFTVDPGTALSYDLTIDTSRIGAFIVRDETSASSSNSLTAVTGTLDGPVNGGLALASLAGLNTSNTTVSDFNQSNTTILTGLSGGIQQFTLTFAWSGSTSSSSGANGGDESVILMGLNTQINGDVGAADDYPGTSGHTNPLADGHFVNISAVVTQVQIVPEPSSVVMASLAGIGLGLAALRRRKA